MTRRKYYTKKYLLQIKDRILLYLDNYIGLSDQPQLPLSLTQSGIARALEIRRSQVSQVMGPLVDDGLVRAELRHIQGGKRRRTCYFLTSRGMDYARRVEVKTGSEVITLRELSRATRTVRLEEVPRILDDGSTLLDVITHTRKSLFDLASYQKKVKKKRKLVAYTSKLPKLHRFFGRRRELERIRGFLNSEEQKIMAIKGIAGIGKSILATKILKEKKGKTNLFYYQLKKWTTLRGLLLSLSKLLSELERNDLRFYLESNKELDVDEVGLILEESLRGLEGILVLDDCQFAKGEVLNFLECSKDFLGASNNFKMIVLGRRIPPFYGRRDVTVGKHVVEMELGGLSAKECQEFLSSRKLSRSVFDNIIEKTDGHPLFLELVDSTTQIISGDIEKFLEQEISSKLSEKEKTAMSIASVFRNPVSASAFFADEKLDYGVIDSLVSQSLLSEDTQGKYSVHEMLKEFFYNRLTDSGKNQYHNNAADYYSNFSDPLSVLEAQHHFVKGGLFEQAAELVALYGEDLISGGYSDNLLEILGEMKDPETWGTFVGEVFLLKGRILDLLGKWKHAVENLKKAEKILADEGDRNLELEATSRIGEILRRQGKDAEALEILSRVEKEITEQTKPSVVTRIYVSIALAYGLQADFDKAYSVLNLLDDYTSAHPNRPERAEYFMARGTLLTLQNLHQQSYEAKKQAIEICEENQDVLRLASAYNGLGVSLYHLGKNDSALEYYERAIKFAQRIGDLRTQGYLLFNTASVYIEMPKLSRAQEYLDSAREIFERLEENRMVALIDLSLAFVHYEREELSKADELLRLHLERIEKHGTSSDLMRSFKMAADLYEEMGLTDQARKCFELALSLSERLARP
ncbi:MAG: tetratricopeptide repeat protein, partial [Thermoplasmata archaeon]